MLVPRHDSEADPWAPRANGARDHAWATGIRTGNEQAFEALFAAYHGPLCTFAYRYVQARDIAEELVQEVFLYLWEHRAEWEERAQIRTYLFTAVRNAAVSYLRHERVVRRSAARVIEIFTRSRLTADGDLRAGELAHALQRAIDRLPERCRLVFTLGREQGLTYAEIATVLGISPKTVEVQMGRAYKALRKHLAGYWP